MLLMCIRDGKILDLDRIGHLLTHIRVRRRLIALNYIVF